ncbi:GlxA family transcriptional regulator [Pseudomonas aeruginosa]|uniref:GlxA family transcriptional regulator n=1 Tax=Pseudomonas aeruginosa TaxID=287 RepID=UPI0003C8C17A|nr:helix-turn-helix domain-containing protein [Pseudomonas aeruginosa]EJM8826842.1 helix-turn-helix domain-containing protein [Pseudomonas aeruginosa]EKT8061465.1 helix-turn-helix domain-containing protein [Pseudomonas aeruginosa]EKU7998593.1 helix-turn-helix domain-containing protein [Pseudomonas aeruginosa]EKU8275012.1 helix-turn-helix domain-containing protein [Pseudomonas aeruginosa]EKV2965825.1 helix-turn-helix domain-containing protein [Pseudomonas aeruginosa]
MRTSFESVLRSRNLAHLDQVKHVLAAPQSARRVIFVLREHFSMLAFSAAMDALLTANIMTATPLFKVQVAGSERSVTSDLGLSVATGITLVELHAQPQDILIVCGGFRVRLAPDPLLRGRLRQADAAGAVLGGLWNGAYFLAEAGLLDGHECAFHPDGRAVLAEVFPNVKVSASTRVVDRRRITCAGPNSALGMMLDVVCEAGGQELLSAVEEVLNSDKLPDATAAPVSSVAANPSLPRTLRLALELMSSNIEDPMGHEDIARYVRISRRHLERLFRRHVGTTPERYYLELRLTHARQLLQHTQRPLIEVALASGFCSLPHFHRCFRELFNITPGQFRARGGW